MRDLWDLFMDALLDCVLDPLIELCHDKQTSGQGKTRNVLRLIIGIFILLVVAACLIEQYLGR